MSGSEAITPVAAGATSYTLTCTKTGGAATTSATVSLTTLPPVPVVSISASPDHIVPGDSVTLTWSSTDATSCTASDAWSGSKATSGSTTVTPPAGLDFYTLTCTGPGGSGVGKATVTATYPAPTMSFSASSLVISQGQSSTLSWSSTNTTGCTASGAWSGAMATAGTLSVTPAAGNQTYNLSCSGAGGVAHQSVTITVQAAAASGGGGGGGAGDAGMLAGLGALLLLRRRTRAAA